MGKMERVVVVEQEATIRAMRMTWGIPMMMTMGTMTVTKKTTTMMNTTTMIVVTNPASTMNVDPREGKRRCLRATTIAKAAWNRRNLTTSTKTRAVAMIVVAMRIAASTKISTMNIAAAIVVVGN